MFGHTAYNLMLTLCCPWKTGTSMADPKDEQLLDRLREYVQEQGEHNCLTMTAQPLLH